MAMIKFSGRPPVFRDPQDMLEQIEEYFAFGLTIKTIICGKAPNQYPVEVQVPTITGLCMYLGFESRQSFYDYEQKEDFSYIVKNARLAIETHYEEQLSVGNTVGSIFALKNMGWKDNQGREHTGAVATTSTIVLKFPEGE